MSTIERGYCLRGDDCPFDHGSDRIMIEDPMGGFAGTRQYTQPNVMPLPARPPGSAGPQFQSSYSNAMGMRPMGYGV